MSSSKHSANPRRLTMWLCCTGVAIAGHSAWAEQQLSSAMNAKTQIDRYSVIAVAPTAEQQDLLSVTKSITIADDINTVGDALHWLLRDSGYRLADHAVLSEDAIDMLDLPLPNAHRAFEPMPLNVVIGLMVGPAFHLVQDPVHRIIGFERCADASHPTSAGGAH